MEWIVVYFDRVFGGEELPDLREYAESIGISKIEFDRIETTEIYRIMYARFKRVSTMNLPKIAKMLNEKALKGDIPSIRLLYTLIKPEEAEKGNFNDPMDSY